MARVVAASCLSIHPRSRWVMHETARLLQMRGSKHPTLTAPGCIWSKIEHTVEYHKLEQEEIAGQTWFAKHRHAVRGACMLRDGRTVLTTTRFSTRWSIHTPPSGRTPATIASTQVAAAASSWSLTTLRNKVTKPNSSAESAKRSDLQDRKLHGSVLKLAF